MKHPVRLAVVSLGCSKNLVDTEVMLGTLQGAGCEMVEDPAKADVLLVNTCAFLTEAVEEALEQILLLAEHKKKGRARRLVVAGCLVSRYGEKLLDEVPEIDVLIHPKDMAGVAHAVLGAVRGSWDAGDVAATVLRENADSPSQERLPFLPRTLLTPPHRAYLKIAEGCLNRCAYCLIPSLRGDFVSRPLPSLVEEMSQLVESGVREVTLVSQDSTRYGHERGQDGLARLMRELVHVPGSYWLRVLYTHPARVSDALLDAFLYDPRICRYLDVPFQHVAPKVLARMNRAETPDPLGLVHRVRGRLPGVFLRTTLMVGFPGETEADFEELLRFVEAARFDHLGAFAYSPEEGTPAFDMDPQVDEEVARERLDRLMMLQAELSAEKLAAMVGEELLVLSEGSDSDGVPVARHAGQAPEVDGVVELDRPVPAGEFVKVKVTESDVHDLRGTVL